MRFHRAKRRPWRRALLPGPVPWRGLLALALLAVAGAAQAADVVDDRGRTVTLEEPARRIVTLAPSLTELVYAAGAGDRLVAVSKYSDHPPPARKLPRVADAFSVNLEKLLAFEPDLVLAWGSGNDPEAMERIESLGIPVFVLEPRAIDDIPRALARLGRLLGTRGTALVRAREYTQSIEAIRERYAGRRTIRVFYQVARRPLTTLNGRHVVTAIIELCGGVNIFAGLGPIAPPVNREQVLARDPAVILVSGGPAAVESWSSFPSITAARLGNIYRVDSDVLNRQTPRLVQGARQVCERLEQARRNLDGQTSSTRNDEQRR